MKSTKPGPVPGSKSVKKRSANSERIPVILSMHPDAWKKIYATSGTRSKAEVKAMLRLALQEQAEGRDPFTPEFRSKVLAHLMKTFE